MSNRSFTRPIDHEIKTLVHQCPRPTDGAAAPMTEWYCPICKQRWISVPESRLYRRWREFKEAVKQQWELEKNR